MKRWMVLGLLACACGSSDGGSPDGGNTPTGTGTITGTVNGHALTVRTRCSESIPEPSS
jgi:hypothetical protein